MHIPWYSVHLTRLVLPFLADPVAGISDLEPCCCVRGPVGDGAGLALSAKAACNFPETWGSLKRKSSWNGFGSTGDGSISIDTIFSGMNIHLPAILGFTRYQGFDPSPTHSGCWRRLGSRPAWKPFGRSRLGGLVEHPIVKGLLISSKIPSGNLTVCYWKWP